MGWRSVFARGTCWVEVYLTGHQSQPDFNGDISLGESSQVFMDGGGTSWQVSVDANGAVSLATDAVGGSFESNGITVTVYPDYADIPTMIADYATKQTSIATIKLVTASPNDMTASDDLGLTNPSNPAHCVALTRSGTDGATPDPVVFPVHTIDPQSGPALSLYGGLKPA